MQANNYMELLCSVRDRIFVLDSQLYFFQNLGIFRNFATLPS